MFELRCFNVFSTITVRYHKDQYKQMIEYANFIKVNFNMVYEYELK